MTTGWEQHMATIINDALNAMRNAAHGGPCAYSESLAENLERVTLFIDALARSGERISAAVPELRRLHETVCSLMQRPGGKA